MTEVQAEMVNFPFSVYRELMAAVSGETAGGATTERQSD